MSLSEPGVAQAVLQTVLYLSNVVVIYYYYMNVEIVMISLTKAWILKRVSTGDVHLFKKKLSTIAILQNTIIICNKKNTVMTSNQALRYKRNFMHASYVGPDFLHLCTQHLLNIPFGFNHENLMKFFFVYI